MPRFSGLNLQSGAVEQSTITVAFGIVTLIGLVLLGFLYLYQVFGTASQGTDIQQLESHMIELSERQRELELEGASLRSLQTVEENVQELNLVTADTVAFLAATPDRVALVQE